MERRCDGRQSLSARSVFADEPLRRRSEVIKDFEGKRLN